MTQVEGLIHYSADNVPSDFKYVPSAVNERDASEWGSTVDVRVPIADGRPEASQLTLDRQGFRLIPWSVSNELSE